MISIFRVKEWPILPTLKMEATALRNVKSSFQTTRLYNPEAMYLTIPAIRT
jgi:hypothetical protein